MGERRTIEEVNGGDNLTDLENTNLNKRTIHIHGGMEHNLLGIPNTIHVEAHKFQEVVNSQEKLIKIEEIFLNIGKQMLETSYILSLGQLLEISPKLKRYLWKKLKLKKT
jgi:hypothetical protein